MKLFTKKITDTNTRESTREYMRERKSQSGLSRCDGRHEASMFVIDSPVIPDHLPKEKPNKTKPIGPYHRACENNNGASLATTIRLGSILTVGIAYNLAKLSQRSAVVDINFDRRAIIEDYEYLQIHCFSDASEKVYGACIYLRSIDERGETWSRLLCSKSLVAPLKSLSLPRLELCAALLSAKLFEAVTHAL